MESRRVLILVLASVVIAAVLMFILLSIFFQGRPPVEVSKFTGGNPLSSDVVITDVFQVTREDWVINLVSKTAFPGWSLEVELFEEGEYNSSVRSLLGKWDLLGDRVVWELGPGTTEGTFQSPTDYQPDLPSGKYYLIVHWSKVTWAIHIFEEP